MEHLENHPHAFIKDGVVINIAAFDGHTSDLLELFKSEFTADFIICCCDNGLGYVNGTWDGERFYPPKPYPNWVWFEEGLSWLPPVTRPTDAYYEWIQDENKWQFIGEFENQEE